MTLEEVGQLFCKHSKWRSASCLERTIVALSSLANWAKCERPAFCCSMFISRILDRVRMATYLKILGHKSRVERGTQRSSEMAESDIVATAGCLRSVKMMAKLKVVKDGGAAGEQGWLI